MFHVSGRGTGGSALAKHVCGSCRFFEVARDGKQGWCTHPDRQESTSIRLLVRAAELRCRNDWGQDQWEERVESDTVLGVVMNDSSSPRPPRIDRVVPPPIETVVPAELSSTPLMPVSRQSVESETSEPARPVSANLDRELVRKARENFRERQQSKGYTVPQPAKVESEPLVISNQYIPPSRDSQSHANRGLTNSVFEFPDSGHEDKFDAVPEVDSQREQNEAASPIRKSARQRPRSAVELPDLEPFEDEQPESGASYELEPEMSARPAEAWPELDEFVDPLPDRDYNEIHAFTDDRDESAEEVDWRSWEKTREPERPSVESQGIWANIPRCCRTCRDYRPAGNGERGWCNNQWAFKHRRMVDADDRPCETSIGHWWVPGDEVWQGEFDVSALGQPTPLMDRWFGRSAGTETAAEAPVERRRRKASSW